MFEVYTDIQSKYSLGGNNKIKVKFEDHINQIRLSRRIVWQVLVSNKTREVCWRIL